MCQSLTNSTILENVSLHIVLTSPDSLILKHNLEKKGTNSGP